MKRGHRPLRTCRACGKKAPKTELVRWTFVRGEFVEDKRQDMPGRGAYCCPTSECRVRLLKNQKKIIMALRLKSLSGKKTGVIDEQSSYL